jgi:hypothetical protein
MVQDFPDLCDVYTLPIHPAEDNWSVPWDFTKPSKIHSYLYYWTYTALDKYLALDIEQVLSSLKFD